MEGEAVLEFSGEKLHASPSQIGAGGSAPPGDVGAMSLQRAEELTYAVFHFRRQARCVGVKQDAGNFAQGLGLIGGADQEILTVLRNELGGFLAVLRNELAPEGWVRFVTFGEEDANGPDALEILGLQKVAEHPAKLLRLCERRPGGGRVSIAINKVRSDVQFRPAILCLQRGKKATGQKQK